MESDNQYTDVPYIVDEHGEGEFQTSNGPVPYTYMYPKRFHLQEMIAFESQELKEFIIGADLSHVVPT